ncbi:Flavocytochrome c [Delitschia confertaspora ATCC 74209]|uniref:Fumarate reductase n=1 Tax=Delitschia confertaspora ATCC 74209 TaxID=1513339 RepID=A0A9P4MTJ5_9PLEO|nr:Flavocytochrome c [Delitschia confertaspora ATCC 74209]
MTSTISKLPSNGKEKSETRAIIIGSGLAGLSTASTLLSHGIPVLMVDRSPSKPGGNSIKASSGINGLSPNQSSSSSSSADSVSRFENDTITSAGKAMETMPEHRKEMIKTLVEESADAIKWLEGKGVDLKRVAQLGGHSVARTHRPMGGAPPGWAIVSTLLKELQSSPLFELRTNCTVTELLTEEEEAGAEAGTGEEGRKRVVGVRCAPTEKADHEGDDETTVHGPVVVTTGGFAGDNTGLLAKYRPDLARYPSTNDARPGSQPLLTAIGAQLIDMSLVQVHPTGFIDPKDPENMVKFLAAEMLRGEGGILLEPNGSRFINELETREKITDAITTKPVMKGKLKQWSITLVLDEGAYAAAKSHVDFYLAKGLMRKTTLEDPELGSRVLETVQKYCKTVERPEEHPDDLNRRSFGQWALKNPTRETVVYVGNVTPVVHFTMGGVLTDTSARVLDSSNNPITGVWAAGEVVGGLHGRNRLGGNSLLECVVFGRRAGRNVGEWLEKVKK